jgi:glycosyltransferase involved in cell wall biosynthesis
VDPRKQIEELGANVVYLHQWRGAGMMEELRHLPVPVLKFFHDHELFCLRGHKYTTIGSKTCSAKVGFSCYPCLGFVNRSQRWPGIRLRTVGDLEVEQRRHRGLDGFVVGSSYMADHAELHGFDRSKIHLAPLYTPVPGETPPITKDFEQLLFVGHLTHGKGLDVLIRALRLTSHRARLCVVGSGRQEEFFRALVERLRLGDYVQFIGQKRPQELSWHYRRAACLVMPSRAPETFGLVGLEAMSHGLPVIASAVGGIPEWLEDGRTGLAVPPNDPVKLAAAIDRILGNTPLIEAMGRAGMERHRERFLPEHHATRLSSIFRSVCGAR